MLSTLKSRFGWSPSWEKTLWWSFNNEIVEVLESDNWNMNPNVITKDYQWVESTLHQLNDNLSIWQQETELVPSALLFRDQTFLSRMKDQISMLWLRILTIFVVIWKLDQITFDSLLQEGDKTVNISQKVDTIILTLDPWIAKTVMERMVEKTKHQETILHSIDDNNKNENSMIELLEEQKLYLKDQYSVIQDTILPMIVEPKELVIDNNDPLYKEYGIVYSTIIKRKEIIEKVIQRLDDLITIKKDIQSNLLWIEENTLETITNRIEWKHTFSDPDNKLLFELEEAALNDTITLAIEDMKLKKNRLGEENKQYKKNIWIVQLSLLDIQRTFFLKKDHKRYYQEKWVDQKWHQTYLYHQVFFDKEGYFQCECLNEDDFQKIIQTSKWDERTQIINRLSWKEYATWVNYEQEVVLSVDARRERDKATWLKYFYWLEKTKPEYAATENIKVLMEKIVTVDNRIKKYVSLNSVRIWWSRWERVITIHHPDYNNRYAKNFAFLSGFYDEDDFI